MPRSANRRTIEIPAALYDELAAEAAAEGTTLATHLQNLIMDGREHRQWYGRVESALWELRRSADRQTRVLERVAAAMDPPRGVGTG